ncbi:MAG: nitrate ABC transporter ATP-binding protein [Pseudanabaenaceae cyanobacterium SKYGB_i_bin29]|nr:nitrate ABC transporter ATP-binding protein [Pseudanabaenaceae cyanobacterium SKYG29]MDW8422010.1 nitrate ABC transporter ATP-binding protein [Pseudanabaenaceae cyanobacterium SKYGB_i_bin29]
MTKPLIEIDHVDMVFPLPDGRTYTALKDIHLEVREGEFVSLLGHSGCGKSTLLNIVAGFLRPSVGGVVMAGRQVMEPGPDRMVVFQNYSLLPWKTVYGNVALAVRAVFPRISATERRQRIQKALESVHLWEARHKYPIQLSGGMKQRVAIARALAITPRVLLLDEPFGALDALTRGSLQEELMAVCQQSEMTCLMVTHDVDEALLLSDRVVMLTNGPAARVGQILRVPFPRPRNRHDVVNHPSYYTLRQQIVDFLHQQKRRSAPVVLTPAVETEKVTIGYLPLTDCAPLLVAKELGLFAKYGLAEVELSRENSWAEIIEGVTSGRLQAAQMLAPLPIALAVGLQAGQPQPSITVPLVLSRNGIGITFGNKLIDQGVTNFLSLAEYIERRKEHRLVFGVVHTASMHNLLLRYELARAGIDPDRDVELVVAPPSQMVYHLQAGHIDGFCVGQPWNSYAVHEGMGTIVSTSLDIWDGHPEKVLAVNTGWAVSQPEQQIALVKALLAACEYCDDVRKRETVLTLLTAYLDVAPEVLAQGFTQPLKMPLAPSRMTEKIYHRLHQFYVDQSYCPAPSEGVWLLTQLARWEVTPLPQNWWEVVHRTYQVDVFAEAARELGIPDTVPDRRSFSLSDGIEFNADEPLSYLEQFPIRRAIDYRAVSLV